MKVKLHTLFLTALSLTTLIHTFSPLTILAEDNSETVMDAVTVEEHDGHDHDTSLEEANQGYLDPHDLHNHGNIKVNFIPKQILTADGATYEAPAEVAEYVGFYRGQARIESLDADLNVILNIQEDGLFNLATYYSPAEAKQGKRFYADAASNIKEVESEIYYHLTRLSGAIIPSEFGLSSGILAAPINPIVLFDENGEAEKLMDFVTLAFGDRTEFPNQTVYTYVGLDIVEDVLSINVNQLIGLDEAEKVDIILEEISENDPAAFLVEETVFELQQANFEELLVNYGDFAFEFKNYNDFLQMILAMQLTRNLSFPADIQIEYLDADQVSGGKASLGNYQAASQIEPIYALNYNNSHLFAYDGENLFISDTFTKDGVNYKQIEWETN